MLNPAMMTYPIKAELFMVKKTTHKTPPARFTESYQFIQSMFQEPVSRRERWAKLLPSLRKLFVVICFGIVMLGLVIALIYFDVLNTTLTESGLFIPSRWP